MKNKILHSAFSILLSISVVLPFAIQTLHAFEGHEHTICTAKGEKHFHEQSTDCSIYHQIIEQNSIDFSIEFELQTPTTPNHIQIHFHQKLLVIFLQLKSSRAPPFFIV